MTLALALAATTLACGAGKPAAGGARDVRLTSAQGEGGVSEAEVLEDIQRFTGQFMDRIAQATWEAEPAADAAGDEAMRRGLLYMSAALDIVSEPLPEIAVIDMAVFLQLSKDALTDYWIPRLFHERGQRFVEAFERSQADLQPILAKITTEAQRASLTEAIVEWRQANPDQHRVEGVRLSDLSAHAGAVARRARKS